jgi:hypothetical protein
MSERSERGSAIGAKKVWHEGMIFAIRAQNMELIEYFINKIGVKNVEWNLGFINACDAGNIDIIMFFIENGKKLDYNQGGLFALYAGHIDILELLIQNKYILNVNWLDYLIFITSTQNEEIIQYCLNKVKQCSFDKNFDWENVIITACNVKNSLMASNAKNSIQCINIILLEIHNVFDWDKIIKCIITNNMDILPETFGYLIYQIKYNNIVFDWYGILIMLCEYNKIDFIQDYIIHCFENIPWISTLCYIFQHYTKNIEIIETILNIVKGDLYENWMILFEYAISHNKLQIVELLMNYSNIDINKILEIAIKTENLKFVKIFFEKGVIYNVGMLECAISCRNHKYRSGGHFILEILIKKHYEEYNCYPDWNHYIDLAIEKESIFYIKEIIQKIDNTLFDWDFHIKDTIKKNKVQSLSVLLSSNVHDIKYYMRYALEVDNHNALAYMRDILQSTDKKKKKK